MASKTDELSLADAIELGRGQRGRGGPEGWTRVRAQVLQEISRGLTRARIGGSLGVSSQRVTQLIEEACDAVLRGQAHVRAAEEACLPTWQRWCEGRSDELACKRLRDYGPIEMTHLRRS